MGLPGSKLRNNVVLATDAGFLRGYACAVATLDMVGRWSTRCHIQESTARELHDVRLNRF
jgi:hypothetical protein